MKWLNNQLCKVFYFPFAICFVIMFAIVNVVLLPFAYLVKLKSIIVAGVQFKRELKSVIQDFVRFMFLGPLVLLITIW